MTTTTLAPRVPGVPFFGNALSYLRDPLAFLRSASASHGDVARVSLGPLSVVLVSHPDLVEDMLVTRNRLFQKDVYLRTTLRPVLGQGLLSSEGDFWRRQRRLAQPAFHRDRIAAYGEIMVAHASRLADRWRDGQTLDVHTAMMGLTLEIVAETLFGTSVTGQTERVAHALEDVLAVVADPLELFFPVLTRLPTPKRKRFARGLADLDAIIYGLIEQRRASVATGGNDLLSMLLDAQDEDGTQMSDVQLRDECMTLFLAGHETTALNLSWTWLLLSQNPDVDAKLARELDEVLGDRRPALADLPKLRYASHVIAESLRMYPPAWSMGREACEATEIGGFHVAQGEQIWFCPWSIQRDARWFEAPDVFRPERWEGDLAKSLHRYAYFPFGGGPRFCIGQAFAQMEAVLLLATLARRFRVTVLPEPRVVPDTSVTLRPKNGMRVRISKR